MFWSYPVSEDMQEWITESFLWSVQNGLLSRQNRLVLPTKEFFTAPKGEGPETVRALLADMQRQLGIADAPIEIAPLDKLPAEYRHEYGALGETAGTWQADEEQALIRYDPALFHMPLALISTLVHELMHHVLHFHVDGSTLPGGAEAEELSTDLQVISTGFGVVQLAGAEQVGWQGYLSQPSRAHALALFLQALELDEAPALTHLPPRSIKYLRRALSHHRKFPEDVEAVRQALTSSPGNAVGRPA